MALNWWLDDKTELVEWLPPQQFAFCHASGHYRPELAHEAWNTSKRGSVRFTERWREERKLSQFTHDPYVHDEDSIDTWRSLC